MKVQLSAGALAIALLLSGCGDGGNNVSSAAGNEAAPLTQIPAPNNGDWTEVASRTEQGGFLLGNPNAPVKLVEYASLTCPACRAFSEEGTDELRNTYIRSGQVSWEFRNFVLNAQDAAVSILSRCLAPSAFFRSVEQLYEQQPEWTASIDEAESQRIQALPETQQLSAIARAMDMDTFFARRGMPETQFSQCLADQQAATGLAEMNQRAVEQDGVQGTPTFLINGAKVDASRWSELEPLLRGAIGG